MTMISKGTLGICAGVAGALFLGYCIYFDQRRRSDPEFKKKLRERRRKTAKSSAAGGKSVNWPNLKDQEAVQKFFLAQVQAGEELLAQGEVEAGVEHLSRAVAVCGQPQQLLQVLQQTLPPQVFQMLLQKLPAVGESILQAAGGPKVSEEDVE
ncbi:mitochondrial import receptor subunit TOM20 homolog [Penaeus vannamei]|uniref:mitochondrial import receptor subunit TOM20 homolog n=1 Tax=Penaeus vannamei TaxID=6689 RepID=UPI000F65B5A2|nr:mitochondrial import receptor subunit TOM20 homolog [Penaeus vannamei]XP_037788402.1 mitochondrial import receptor subunit TOM20 homolog [Penaeus monodon]XP_042889304.1 mitochondrial import receptor subunit TOM20 homolog [Penaeus japonicus]XP_047483645.1 mitochondrial import receptor subunit TOM20 homolog [Penaeus chinensis]